MTHYMQGLAFPVALVSMQDLASPWGRSHHLLQEASLPGLKSQVAFILCQCFVSTNAEEQGLGSEEINLPL